MERNTTISLSDNLFKCVESVAVSAEGSKLGSEFFKKNKKALRKLASFFEINEIQTIILCVIINLNFKNSKISLGDIANYLDVAPVSVLVYLSELEGMISKKLVIECIRSSGGGNKRNRSIESVSYFITTELIDALKKGEKFTIKEKPDHDLFNILESVKQEFIINNMGEGNGTRCLDEIKRLLEKHSTLPFVSALKRLALDDESLMVLLYMVIEFIDDFGSGDFHTMIHYLFQDIRVQVRLRREFMNGTHPLIMKGLTELTDGRFMGDQMISISEKGLDVLFMDKKENQELTDKRKRSTDFILAEDILPKKLHFGSAEQKYLDVLTDTLKAENHLMLTNRLKAAGMPTGVTILLFGAPGTGKTEAVYQLAQRTGRDIWTVNISETKNKYFGESERLIKRVFDDYRRIVEQSYVAPILLFNEADGILSTRKTLGESEVGQTENAIQNILLQEMEDLTGIMIATTNLTCNLDKAFERRFLYKLKFEKPNSDIQRMIWKDKIQEISEAEISLLTCKYDLSGGQIENVARKYLMKRILNNTTPLFVDLEEYCEEELVMQNKKRNIGFNRPAVTFIA